jgi:hypothetical protein
MTSLIDAAFVALACGIWYFAGRLHGINLERRRVVGVAQEVVDKLTKGETNV